jgi:hypothetical protein
MLQKRVLQNHFNKTNVYFVTLKQVFHIEIYVFDNFSAIMQYVSTSYF